MRRSARSLILATGAGWLAGCAQNSDLEIHERGFTHVFTPQVPVFLSGPAAVLLTNDGGFSAHVTLQRDADAASQGPHEGELLGRGSKLLFAPKQGDSAEKSAHASGFSYVWDVSSASGYVMSEALQAYAPVSSNLRATNLVLGPTQAGARDATVMLNNGWISSFRVWPDTGHNGFPYRIHSITSSPPLVITISKMRLQPPPPELFSPPDGFSKYPTPEALADELAVRQHNLRRGGRWQMDPSSLPSGTQR